jgi:hypothetical protein
MKVRTAREIVKRMSDITTAEVMCLPAAAGGPELYLMCVAGLIALDP